MISMNQGAHQYRPSQVVPGTLIVWSDWDEFCCVPVSTPHQINK